MHDERLVKDYLSSLPSSEIDSFLESLSENALLSLPWLFEHWAHDHQRQPEGDWKTWVIMGGRGAGKTRAGAEWVRNIAEGPTPEAEGKAKRIALIAETVDQARDVMVFGESGIIACSPPDRAPVWKPTLKQLVWPNGTIAQVFSASSPESLRGPQFDAAWSDELAKWKKGRETWDMLQFALRLGENPQQIVTTTPRDVKLLRDILAEDSTVRSQAPTSANEAYLADSFLQHVEVKYGGTRLGRQELDGELLTSAAGALWTHEGLDAQRLKDAPKLDRIIVAIDPPVTGHAGSDECGIIVAGVEMTGPPQDWRAYVLLDASHSGAPQTWANTALNLAKKFDADRIVAEVNQGGDLIETLLRNTDPLASYKAVRATRGKSARAEPVAALYEQGRVFHVGHLGTLEDQMCAMTLQGYGEQGSPDRVDALVWAITELMIDPAAHYARPQIRGL